MLSVILLNVFMLSVIMLYVMMPVCGFAPATTKNVRLGQTKSVLVGNTKWRGRDRTVDLLIKVAGLNK